jgi:hypothetical protein
MLTQLSSQKDKHYVSRSARQPAGHRPGRLLGGALEESDSGTRTIAPGMRIDFKRLEDFLTHRRHAERLFCLLSA